MCIGRFIDIFQSRLLEIFNNAHINFFLFVFKLTSPKVFNIRLRIPTHDTEAKLKYQTAERKQVKFKIVNF